MSEPPAGTMEIRLFPYLPLRRRCEVGGWELIPRAEVTADDTTTEAMVEHAEDVAALYRMPGRWAGFGAFVRPPGGRVGQVATGDLEALHHAVAAALLDRNPSRARPADDENPNAGHAMCTTENALLRAHQFGPNLYVGYRRGAMVLVDNIGPQLGRDTDVIEPPVEVTLPVFPPMVDPIYADALYQLLAHGTEDDPDLAGAISWLEVAWLNAELLDQPARLLPLRAGFDTLFGGGSTAVVRQRLSNLLDEPDANRTPYVWQDRGRTVEGELTHLEWWFQSFALLRNKLAHGGGEIAPEEYLFESIPHLWHAEYQLRRAIKQTVANAGHPDVLLPECDRLFREARQRLEDESGEADTGQSPANGG